MNLMTLGYCANLAYVVHVNSFGVSFDKKLCHFGMVLFGIVTLREYQINQATRI